MSTKRALIVDDSKSARVVLGRMLQKYDMEVDTAESAEVAIDYLKQNRPDVIFMDHLMPGMDGFQAVQAIKNNPQTATIPIMMYTSQQGELYVGQARALGAVGVLPKLVKPVDVSKVLYQLHLLPERRDYSPPAFVNANPAAAPLPPSSESQSAVGLVPADWHPQLESALRNHDAELRRFVVASLDSLAERVSSEVRNLVQDTSLVQAPPSPPSKMPLYPWLAAVALALLPGLVLGIFYLRTIDYNKQLAADVARLEQNNTRLSLAVDRLSRQSASTVPTARPASPPPEPLVTGKLPIAAPLIEPVPYGEVPLANARVETFRDLIAQLREQSFSGVLRIETFGGQFCLKGNPGEGYILAPTSIPATECDLIGNPHGEALSPAQHESLAFANVASSLRQNDDERLRLQIVVGGDRVLAPYPRPRENVTAGQWNEVATRNNRVEFRAVPNKSGSAR